MYLQEHGAEASVTDDAQRYDTAADLGVPREAISCHTAIVEGYAVEGHVPMEAILQLLADQPDAVGLALPGMPSDSPGMGGDTQTWQTQPVMLISNDGSLERFEY